MADSFHVGQNVEIKVAESKIVVTIDLKQAGVPSKSGKTMVIASTHGNIAIAGTGVILGVNAYKKEA